MLNTGRIVGRDGEQERLDRLLADARAGRSGELVIAGEAGIGKTVLLEDARSAAAGMRVVRGVGVETEAELPFSGLHLLLHRSSTESRRCRVRRRQRCWPRSGCLMHGFTTGS